MRAGRLANRLVLFANVIAFVEERGYRLSNVTFHSYAHLFDTTLNDLYCRYPVPPRRSALNGVPGFAPFVRKTRILYRCVRLIAALVERRPRVFGKRFVTLGDVPPGRILRLNSPEVEGRIANAGTVFVYDWSYRAPELVQKHAAKIRAYFRPVSECERSAADAITRLRQRGETVVGVHIRRGDYRGWRGGKYFYEISRYVEWMRQMVVCLPNRRICFFVCSDESRTPGEFDGLPVEIGSGPAINDLFTLSQCDFILGPPSTFSQWASFYGNAPLLHLSGMEDLVTLEKFRVSFFEDIPGVDRVLQ